MLASLPLSVGAVVLPGVADAGRPLPGKVRILFSDVETDVGSLHSAIYVSGEIGAGGLSASAGGAVGSGSV